MKNIIVKAQDHSFSYNEYREYVSKLISEGKSTGHTQTEDLLHYSELNETRLKRLDKTIKVIPEIEQELINLSKK